MRVACRVVLIAVCLLVVTGACESPPVEHPPGPVELEMGEIPTPWGPIITRTQYHPPPPEETRHTVLDAPEDVCWEVRFYDDQNGLISSHAGSGSDVFTWPEGATKAVTAVVACPDEAEPPAPTGAAQLTAGPAGTAMLRQRYLVILQSQPASVAGALSGVPFRSVAAWVRAAGFEGATLSLQAALEAGVGSPLPVGVTLIENTWAWMTLTSLDIEVAYPGPVEAFAVALDGIGVADLAAGQNVTTEVLPQGWYRVGTSLPYAAIDPDATVVVQQQRSGHPQRSARLTL